ncbi:MAG: MBL fold metallo-hydrolase [Bacillota bacterium]
MLNVYEKEDVICIEGEVVKSGGTAGKVFAYLVDGMLVDTGPQSLESDFVSFYKNHSFDLVTLTHNHEDHSGTASWVQANRNVPIYVHEKGIKICAQPCMYPKYRQATWGVRNEFRAMPLREVIHSRNKEWQVIYTPGHAEDHVSLLHKDTGRLFSGDLFVAPKTKVIMRSESIPVIMNSIRTLLTYDFESIFCSHAGYIKNGKGMMKQKLEHLEYLCGEVKSLNEEGLSTIEINEKLFPKKYPIVDISGGEWDSLHIVTSILFEKT